MCLWVVETSFKKLEKLEKQTKAILNSWIGNANPLTTRKTEMERGSGFVSKADRNKISKGKPKFSPIVAKNMQDPTGQFMWLFSGSR